MAKRSDLSQKLLDDLRMRKEKMAMSHTSSYSNQMHKGGNFRKPMQGSRPVNTRETTSSSMGDQNKWLSTSHNRSLIKEGASKEIVPLGRARNSQHIGDLSMALAFALENGGTLRQLTSSGNPMLGFLQHIGRSVDFVQMDRSSSREGKEKKRRREEKKKEVQARIRFQQQGRIFSQRIKSRFKRNQNKQNQMVKQCWNWDRVQQINNRTATENQGSIYWLDQQIEGNLSRSRIGGKSNFTDQNRNENVEI